MSETIQSSAKAWGKFTQTLRSQSSQSSQSSQLGQETNDNSWNLDGSDEQDEKINSSVVDDNKPVVQPSRTGNEFVHHELAKNSQGQITEVITKKFRGGNGFISVSTYNRRGDIIYVGDKDSLIITAINVRDYSIIGTFEGHRGTVWDIEISEDDNILVSCGADLSMGIYNAKSGEILKKIENMVGIPKLAIIRDNYLVVYCEALGKRYKSNIILYEFDETEILKEIKQIQWLASPKITSLEWFNETCIIAGCDNGKIVIKDIFNEGVTERTFTFHEGAVKSICLNSDKTNILTGSLDGKAYIIDLADEPSVIKTFTSTGPINSAIYTSGEKKVVIAGGTAAMDVALTDNNDFKIKIYRIKDQKLVNEISDHFGTVRQLTHSPNSKNFISSGQDGFANIYLFEDEPDSFEGVDVCEQFGNATRMRPESLPLQTKINSIDFVNATKTTTKVKDDKNYIPGMNTKSGSGSSSGSSSGTGSTTGMGGLINKYNKPISFGSTYTNRSEETDSSKTNEVKTIVITNLPSHIGNGDIAKIFKKYGEIEYINIKRKDYETMAFVEFWCRKSAENAIEGENKSSMDSCIIGVEFARPRRF